MLELGGFDVVAEADSCNSALREFARFSPDAVLLDVLLPDGDGVELAAEMSRQQSAVAVVLISSRTAAELGTRINTAIARGFVHKSALTAERFATLVE